MIDDYFHIILYYNSIKSLNVHLNSGFKRQTYTPILILHGTNGSYIKYKKINRNSERKLFRIL